MHTEPLLPQNGKKPKLPIQTERIGIYEPLSLLAKGSLGSIYLAVDTILKKPVILKLLEEEIELDPLLISASKDNPYIVSILQTGTWEGKSFIAMEYVHGVPLSYFNEMYSLSLKAALKIVLQIAKGLHYLHSTGLAHLDITPANIMLTDHGSIKILDFELSSKIGKIRPEHKAHATAGYVSEDVLLGKKVSASSDFYSLGLIALDLILAKKASLHDLILLPSKLKELIGQLLKKESGMDSQKFISDLSTYLATYLAESNEENAPRSRFFAEMEKQMEPILRPEPNLPFSVIYPKDAPGNLLYHFYKLSEERYALLVAVCEEETVESLSSLILFSGKVEGFLTNKKDVHLKEIEKDLGIPKTSALLVLNKQNKEFVFASSDPSIIFTHGEESFIGDISERMGSFQRKESLSLEVCGVSIRMLFS